MRLTVTIDDTIEDELARKAEKCGVSVPTLARLVITYWVMGKVFQSPEATDLQEAA